jgi:hypothetical protein
LYAGRTIAMRLPLIMRVRWRTEDIIPLLVFSRQSPVFS